MRAYLVLMPDGSGADKDRELADWIESRLPYFEFIRYLIRTGRLSDSLAEERRDEPDAED